MCMEYTRLCLIALGAIYLDIFLLSMYTRLEYPSYRDDKGGSTESREGDTESQTGYMHTR